jgi:hypothetical protein
MQQHSVDKTRAADPIEDWLRLTINLEAASAFLALNKKRD